MSLTNSPQIATNGLVYYHDVNNIKSYKGPAVQNLLNQAGPTFTGTGTATGYSSVGGTETVNIPQLGATSVVYNLIQNNYTSYTPNSSNCCPSLFTHGASVPVSGNTLYTYSIVYKCDSGYTNANYMYRYEYNGAAYVTEGGVFNAANQIHLGSGWYWAWGTFTTQPTTTNLLYMGAYYYRYAPTVDKLSVANVLLVAGNYTAMHPRYWPAMNSTRASTDSFIDLAGNSTLTGTSLTYGTDGSASFNGSTSNISVPFNSSAFTFNNEQTIVVWMKNQSPSSARRNPYDQAYGGAGTITHENDTNFNYYYGTAGSNTTPYTSHSSPFSVVVGETAMICITRNIAQTVWYKNGISSSTQANPYGASVVTGTNNITIGSGYAGAFGGNLYSVLVYNRALTASEVNQSFQAFRGRYGL